MPPLAETYLKKYIEALTTDELHEKLNAHFSRAFAFLENIQEEKSKFRYASEKWSLRELLGHISDSQMIFTYRAICIAHGETKSLPGYDENIYAQIAGHDQIAWAQLLQVYKLQSQTTLALVKTLSSEGLVRMGEANKIELSSLNIFQALLGHEKHHFKMMKELYGTAEA